MGFIDRGLTSVIQVFDLVANKILKNSFVISIMSGKLHTYIRYILRTLLVH